MGCPEPRLKGEITRSRVLVAGFDNASGRNSFAAWLDARPQPSATGGTTLAGTIGLHPYTRAMITVSAVLWTLITLIAFAVGIGLLAAGHLSKALPALIIPLAMLAFFAGFNVIGLRSLQQAIPKLIDEVNAVIDSTLIVPGQPPNRLPTTQPAGPDSVPMG